MTHRASGRSGVTLDSTGPVVSLSAVFDRSDGKAGVAAWHVLVPWSPEVFEGATPEDAYDRAIRARPKKGKRSGNP